MLPIIFLYVDLERSLFKKNDILFLQQFFFIFPTNPLRSRPNTKPTLSAIHHSQVCYYNLNTYHAEDDIKGLDLSGPRIIKKTQTEEELLDYLKDLSEFTRDEKGNN